MSIAQHLKEHKMLGGVSGLAGGLSGVPTTLLACGTPIGIAPSGTMGANGAVTLGTAFANTMPGIWLYFPAGAVYSGSAAGFYWVVMSSTTAGTVYDDIHIPGTNSFEVPSSPTAIVDAGPGAYTGSTSEITVHSYTLPGGSLGRHGSLIVEGFMECSNSADSKSHRFRTDGSERLRLTNTSTRQRRFSACVLYNTGSETLQVYGALGGTISWQPGNVTSAPNTALVDTSADVVITETLQLAVATDYAFVLGERWSINI